ncbi:MAG: bifunctional ADP-dependent NAD(P)H-hydrate dehydratase/NAD(P)H-hydrate epimerase, partial [Candidatus Paceibacterota bacterium]
MKIFNKDQIKELEEFTIQAEPIRSIDLMECAGLKVFESIKRRFCQSKETKPEKFHIFCGV